MFLIGFNITQMMNVYLVGSEFALKRFEISASKVSSFVASCHSATTLSILVGIFMGFLLIFASDNVNKVGASITVFLIAFIAFLQLRYFCKSHGHQYVVRFYWLHVASGFCIGLIQMYGFKLFVKEASYYSLGNQLIGCFTSILHYILKKILTWMQLDINFWLIAIHLFFVFLIAFATFIVVSVAVKDTSSTSTTFDIHKFKNGAMHAWAPIIMSVVGLGLLYAIYPVIGPILTVESSRHHTILIWCLLLEATSGIIVYLIVEVEGDIKKKEWYEHPQYYYHLLWFLFVPYFGFGMTLLWALHHPNASFAKTLKFGVWGGVMSCLYYFSAKVISNIGYGCVNGHANNGPGKDSGPYVSTLNVFLANIFLVLFAFLGDAHVRNLMMYTGKVAEGHVFPTDSMGGFRSCWFWFSCATSGAWKNFRSLFSQDLKHMLLSD
ncbi:hypothetical protein BdWA1_001503 [Babesia duncani]|uniref:Uncharacterized protein n=1 Tax=Babesia duncani TaxID=323732 RepID=A0AAD9PK09_9APIC|nr:hypothetical protein BdWA1_001503 [Babesia duncani]